ncbi:bifunctional diguanylate cyclase/phosphodiesterase [Humisphaera borealis]|uniref:EAL domain-containing protein n=1 Tax=Humisphaera borealis TaxID=2807512 RepID=A0A7M2WWQ9_9BACT|nr:EAL domain-containing protein [Humisphaera borealis]QOV89764.1 EAL domain-containing protein [Humisphaera borealis]
MKAPLNTARLFVEILAAIVVGETAAMFILRAFAPNATGMHLAILNVAILGILAGPVVLWRVWAAAKKSDRDLATDSAAGGWRLKLGVVTVLALGLGLSLAAGRQIHSSTQAEARAHFQTLAKDALEDVQLRVNQTAHGLNGARGVYAASKSVERLEFKAYVESRDLPKEFPGVPGMGFIERVMRDDLDAFIAAERADDAPDFNVSLSAQSPGAGATAGPGVALAPDLYIIKHIYPIGPNRPAWGFDAGSEPVRREAIERAIATGQPAISGRISLVQQEKSHTGFLYLMPVFRNGTRPSTPAERMATLTGLVFTPIVLETALADLHETVGNRIDLEIFDGPVADKSAQLFDLDGHLDNASGAVTEANFSGRMFAITDEITVGGRSWTVTLSTTPAFEAEIDTTTPVFTALGGAALTLLGAMVLWTMGSGRARAIALASSMTRELREAGVRSERLAEIARRTSNAVIITDAEGRITWVNEGFTKITGYTLEEVLGKVPGHMLRCDKTDPGATEIMRTAQRRGVGCRVEIVNRGKDGREYVLDIEIQPLSDASGTLAGFMAIESDITEQVEARAAIARSEVRLRTIIDAEPECVKVIGTDGTLLEMNPAGLRMLEAETIEQVRERGPEMFVAPHDRAEFKGIIERALRGEAGSLTFQMIGLRGTQRWLNMHAVPLRDGDGPVTAVVSVTRDITEQVVAENKLKEAAALLEEAQTVGRMGNWSFDLAAGKVNWSKQVYALHGRDEANGPPDYAGVLADYHPEDSRALDAAVEACMTEGKPYSLVLRTSGARPTEARHVRLEGRARFDASGKVVDIFGTATDVTAEVESREALLKAQATLEKMRDRLQAAVTGTSDGLWDWKVATEEVWFSDQFWTLLGFIDPAEFPPPCFASWSDRLHPDDSEATLGALQRHQTHKEPYDVEYRLRMVNGAYRWFRARGASQFDAEGQPIRVAGSIQDIDDRKTMEEQLKTSATTDKLTGLPNRALLLDRLQQEIERHKRFKQSHYAVLFLDFDRFKLVNDSIGHGAGDQLLQEIARRLESTVRSLDSVTRPTQAGTASRFGGDEFVVLLSGLAAAEDALKVADRILEALSTPYMLDGHEVVSTASIGIVTSTFGHAEAEEVLRDADTAMYEAKVAGKGRAVMFDDSMRVRVQRKVELEDGLRRALDAKQFRLFYQPIVSLETRRVEGFEALVRWQHPTHGMISPGEFIPVAEETGLVIPLGEWVFKEACRQLAQWWKTMGRESVPSISVNLSRKQLSLADLPNTLARIADDTGVDRSAIHLEITESAIMSNPEHAVALLSQIRGLGFKIYMDDFGTGHSSLSSLHQFPIDVLKIDRSFIANLSRGREFAALVNAICTLAGNLNFKVVAEGVETVEQVALLQALDCQFAQGYHFSRPLSADNVVKYLAIKPGQAAAA